eukprot:767559-Hanusia_phi.AAC.2
MELQATDRTLSLRNYVPFRQQQGTNRLHLTETGQATDAVVTEIENVHIKKFVGDGIYFGDVLLYHADLARLDRARYLPQDLRELQGLPFNLAPPSALGRGRACGCSSLLARGIERRLALVLGPAHRLGTERNRVASNFNAHNQPQSSRAAATKWIRAISRSIGR